MVTKRNRGSKVQVEVGARLREARRLANLSQAEVGSRIGLSRAGYSHLEDGTRAMTLDDLVNLAQIVNQSPAYLLNLATGLAPDEDRLVSAFRSIDSDRQRKLIVDLAMLAARPEEEAPAEPQGTQVMGRREPARRSPQRPRKPRASAGAEEAAS